MTYLPGQYVGGTQWGSRVKIQNLMFYLSTSINGCFLERSRWKLSNKTTSNKICCYWKPVFILQSCRMHGLLLIYVLWNQLTADLEKMWYSPKLITFVCIIFESLNAFESFSESSRKAFKSGALARESELLVSFQKRQILLEVVSFESSHRDLSKKHSLIDVA